MHQFTATPVIVHHKAALDGSQFPPNSLEAIRECLEADAAFIEIDALPLKHGDFLLVHDDTLESETNGTGPVSTVTPDEAKHLRIRHDGEVTSCRPPLLSEVVALFLEYEGKAASRLQIDYKAVLPGIEDEPLRRLLEIITPLKDRVLVSTGADWHLRALRRMASWLDLGFDIGFYLDYRKGDPDPRVPPHRLNAYGYYDDHILGMRAYLPPAAYLAERCEILLSAVSGVSTWYVSHHLIRRALSDGFNMAAWLQTRGIRLDAWTLDADDAAAVTNAQQLLVAGVHQFTTNTPLALADLLTLNGRS